MPARPDLPCADCGNLMWRSTTSLPVGQARCRACRAANRPAPKPKIPGYGTKSWRDCEVCGQRYRAKQKEQRTCGRACGETLRRTVTFSIKPPATRLLWRDCRHCARPYTTRGGRRCECGQYQPISGLRTFTCKDCSSSFEYVLKSRHPDYCEACREKRQKDRQRSSRRRRRALERGARVEPVNVREVYERDQWRCGLCRRKVNPKLSYPHPRSASLDHVVPLSLHGEHSMANVQLAHLSCNHDKSNGGWQQLALVG